MIVTRKDLILFENLSRRNFIDTPANQEFADGTPLTGQEFRGYVLLKAALSVLQSMGVASRTDDEGMNITVELPSRNDEMGP